jgi:hypothetical protein
MKRAIVIAAAYLALAVALYVFMHTGGRAVNACGAEGSYRTGTVTWWPPGTECAGPAPPASTVIVFDNGYWGALLLAAWPVLTFVLLVGASVRSRLRAAAV